MLFAVSLTTVEPILELRTPKVSERALLSVPPFRIVGHVHLLPDRGLRASLAELHGIFIPVTDATIWSGRLGGAGQAVAFVAVNHGRAQVFAPFHEVDPWTGAALQPSEPPPEPPRRADGGVDAGYGASRPVTDGPVATSGQRIPCGAAPGTPAWVTVVTGRTGSAWQRAQ